jgi:hypothetical protein
LFCFVMFLLEIRAPVHFVSYFRFNKLQFFSARVSVHTFMFRHSRSFDLFEHDGWCWVIYLLVLSTKSNNHINGKY